MNRREPVQVTEVEWTPSGDASALDRLLLLLFDPEPNTEQADAATPARPEENENDATILIHPI